MKQLVIMPGGFHPFHAGHLALYQSALEAFPGADVKVAATNDTSTRPFPFKLKEKLAQLAGVPPGDFYQVKSPFRADEITKNYDPASTQLIFVRSKKDADKPPRPGGILKNGSPAYLQPVSNRMGPMTQHAYMAYLPTVTFGPGMQSATEIRTAWPELDERRRRALVMSLYPTTQKNPKLAKTVVKMLDTAMGTEVAEATGDERFDSIMSRIRREPTIPDAQMPPTDVKDLYHWAVENHKPYHKIFAHWANREGFKSVAQALQKAGNLDSDALDYWTPDVWKLWYGPDAEMPRYWSKERVPDELRDYLEGVFDAYDNIVFDWPTEYRQIDEQGLTDTDGPGVSFDSAEGFKNTIRQKLGRSDPELNTNIDQLVVADPDGTVDVDQTLFNMLKEFDELMPQILQFVKDITAKFIETSQSIEFQQASPADQQSLLQSIKDMQAMLPGLEKQVTDARAKFQQNAPIMQQNIQTKAAAAKPVQPVVKEVTRQMSQGGLRASYQNKYNQPMMEDYLDEARS